MALAAPVVVVTGAGGIGLAAARRLGSGRHLLLASRTEARVSTAVAALRTDGYSVDGYVVDVGDRAAVAKLAAAAGAAGSVQAVVHTAGISAGDGPTEEILRIDLLGCAYVIDEFLAVAGPGTALVCVSSMAGAVAGLPVEAERWLATAPTDALLDLAAPDLRALTPREAYPIAKRANSLRVAGAARAWGRRGARINSVSPGLIATAMGHRELHGQWATEIRQFVESSPAGRIGTAEEVAAAVEFLAGPHASYITGTDLAVDGGAMAAVRGAAA